MIKNPKADISIIIKEKHQMREILFRGKSVKTKEWLYGSYISKYYGNDYIFPQDPPCDSFHLEANFNYHVDPNTIGQYTGLTDKNGTKIFEGDIVRPDDWDAAPVVWDFSSWWLEYPEGYEVLADIPDAVVVGNVHDNPELLEVTK
ncbi:MAG: YopX family protein [Oscillospiraceae bacterium]|jgi:hypothetical protein|nr:YopX family protein [Oscillospiraceae bacterium]